MTWCVWLGLWTRTFALRFMELRARAQGLPSRLKLSTLQLFKLPRALVFLC